MQVTLEAIEFNHNPSSAFCDAFNIRKNETEFVTVPEWRLGVTEAPEQSRAAYAIKAIRENVITIKAHFTCDDPTVKGVQVRAVRLAQNDPTFQANASDQAIASTLLPPPPRRHDVLGWVPPQPISFSEDGDILNLKNSKISQAGVGSHIIGWQWQFRRNKKDAWKDIKKTCHQIYTVVKIPKRPWLQRPYIERNTQLPWTDVLDYACYWARRSKDRDKAAIAITTSFRELEKVFHITYDTSNFYSHPNFDCTSFLRLIKDGIGKGSRLNCSDCATVVSTFANILGCALWQSVMSSTDSIYDTFRTNPIRLFGRTCWREAKFGAHEVAWKCKCSEHDSLFDAALELDGDDHPTSPPQKPLLPHNLKFGGLRDRQYLFRLLSPNFPGTLKPRPGMRKHREIRPNPKSTVRGLLPSSIEFLKSHYEYHAWPKSESSTTTLAAQGFREIFSSNQFLNWDLVGPLELVETSNYPPTFQLLLISNKLQYIRLDIDFCQDTYQARTCLLERLGQFDSPTLEKCSDSKIGEIAFVEREEGALLFLRGNLIALVRNGAQSWVNPKDFGHNLDLFLCEILA